MKAGRGIDLAAVRVARDRLRDLAREHPELTGDGGDEDRAAWEAVMAEDETMANTKQTAFRLPEELVDDLDKYAAQMERENPGMSFSRADAVRVLLTRGLAGAGLVREGASAAKEASRNASTKRVTKKTRTARARKE